VKVFRDFDSEVEAAASIEEINITLSGNRISIKSTSKTHLSHP